MRSRRRTSKSSKQLNVDLPSRKLVLSKSSRDLHCPVANLQKRIEVQKQLIPAKNSDLKRPVILQIENYTIKTDFEQYPLNRQYEYYSQGVQLEDRIIMVISKIDQFSEQYNKYYNQVYSKAKDVCWIIVSNAVNSETIEKEFNEVYQPIRFTFLRSLTAVVNYLNFPNKSSSLFVSLHWFSRILNFQGYQNNYACILQVEKDKKQKMKFQNRELWLFPENQIKLMKTMKRCVLFLQFEEIKDNAIKILDNHEDQILYVIIKDYNQILKGIGLDNLESTITKNQIKSNLSLPLLPSYCEKIMKKDVLDEEIVYCLINFPEKVVKEVKKHLAFVCSFSEKISYKHNFLFCIYYEMKDESDFLGLEFRKDEKIQNEVYRIKNYSQAMKKIGKTYSTTKFDQNCFGIFDYNLNNHQLSEQIQWYTKLPISKIDCLTEVQSVNKKQVIILGRFNEKEKNLLQTENSIYLIDLQDCDNNNLIIHNQILEAFQKSSKHEDSLLYLTTSPKVLSFNVNIQEFSSNPIYINKNIHEFRETLSNIESNYHHMIIMEMNDYTEEKQQKILETEVLKHVTIEVYLKYGKQFIFRNKSDKYNFLKRQQLISKIQELSLHNKKSLILNKKDHSTVGSWHDFDYDQINHSEMVNSPYFDPSYISTPNLKATKHRELLILVPKTLPFHSLINRSNEPYFLLVYSSLQQANFLTKYLEKHQHALIIVGESENIKNLENVQAFNFQYIRCKQLGEKEVRDEIDRIVDKFGLTKKAGTVSKPIKKSQFLVTYDKNDSTQTKLISLMNKIFRTSKIITLSKDQYKEITEKYCVIQKLLTFELGSPEISSAKRVTNVVDLFKVYMSPHSGYIQFTTDFLQFSQRQLFLRECLERLKKDKVKGKLQQLSLSRSMSPRTKSVIGKENVSQAGLVILQSKSVHKDARREIFATRIDLLELLLGHLKKGNNILIIIHEKEYDNFESFIKVKTVGIIWIIITTSIKRTIIKNSTLTFCLHQQLEILINQITSQFRKIKDRDFRFKQDQDQFRDNETISVTIYEKWSSYLSTLFPTNQGLALIRSFDSAYVALEQLKGSLLFGRKSKFEKILSLFHYNSKRKQQQQSSLEIESIIVLVEQRNKQFIERCLKILKEENYILITFQDLSHLLMYSQFEKTLMIFQQKNELRLPASLILHPADTPLEFSSKLAGFILSLRKTS